MKDKKKTKKLDSFRFQIDKKAPDWFMNALTKNTIISHSDGTCDIKTSKGVKKSKYGDYIVKKTNGEITLKRK